VNNRIHLFLTGLLLALAASAPLAAQAAAVTVAVAANFTAPMKLIAERFTQATGHVAKLAFGASGAFYAQIRNGAPFEVLLSADDEIPARLVRDGLAAPQTRLTYALGTLALWSRDAARVDGSGAVLQRTDFKRLAIANPKLAPYGRAALDTLTRLGVLANVEARFVQGENIAQTYQFVASGNAELGFVALSQISQDGKLASGSAWIVPAALHAPIRQDAVLLAAGKDNPAAAALLAYLSSDAARAIIRAYGYRLTE
jgi:molybdate transport system substrate-binding protein